MKYDIAIIGGGPAGYNAAEKAAFNGFKTILFEKKEIGGICLHEGCIPTKTFLYSAKLLDEIKSSEKYGIQAQNISFNHKNILLRKNKIIRKLTAGVKHKLVSSGVDMLQGHAVIKGENDDFIQIECNGELFLSKYILLCTGSETVVPSIKGLVSSDFLTSKEVLEVTELPESVIIIGGGVIGIEFASYLNTMGVKVSIVEMMPKILGNIDREISDILQSEYSKKGIKFYLNSIVREVKGGKVIIEKEGKYEEISANKILISVGRKANIADIGLENLKIETDKKGIKTNNYMQTSHSRVYAAGDITGFSLLAHTAIREGEVAINHILGKKDEMSYKAIPSVVYTNPELAGVGKTEEELSEKGEYYRVVKLPMTYSGRFMIENEGINGLCKLIVDGDDCIIGCHMIGNLASELIVIASIAIEEGLTTEQFRKKIFPHPTIGEIIREVLFE